MFAEIGWFLTVSWSHKVDVCKKLVVSDSFLVNKVDVCENFWVSTREPGGRGVAFLFTDSLLRDTRCCRHVLRALGEVQGH